MFSASVTVSNSVPYLMSIVKLLSMFLIGFGAYHFIHAICGLVSDENNENQDDK
ncbi:hypothetical protein [Ructibacterium gallinarum]|uniref:Uncharacterized protein n=1 Tax=Ructibacterium gallinarum TaxID=2779355 RepID=A0A9D5RC97_9FIRM|nr:hypothetical protein [Ructibacterium gallinarum]MBE5040798.1 hypothetical protein [Ructibacterium gallinarum]